MVFIKLLLLKPCRQAAMSGRSSVNDVRKDTTIDDERPISERSDSLADVSLQTELSEVAGAGSAAWGGSGDRNKMGNQGVFLDADESCSSTDVEEGEPRFLRPPRDMTVEQGETLRNDCRLSGTRPIGEWLPSNRTLDRPIINYCLMIYHLMNLEYNNIIIINV